jgi:hypothetical protein
MDGYPVVVNHLFQAAVGRGLGSQTTTVALADGGNGLREELASQFPNLQFIYDRPHLTQVSPFLRVVRAMPERSIS